jgi:energy-coupling factor transporter ATP-binding protein EcfA2
VYLKSFRVEHIKCFDDVKLDFPSGEDGSHAGWHVILGANATGKTTLLQAMAVALVGPSPAMRLVSPSNWIRRGSASGRLQASFVRGKADSAEGTPRKVPYQAEFTVVGDQPAEVDGVEYTAPQIVLMGSPKDAKHRGLLKGPYAANKSGWLVCGYGAFRRFTGGAEDDLTHEPGRVGRVASLFRESVALKRDLDWLPRLYAKSLETHSPEHESARTEYQTVRRLLDQLLPSPVRIADVDTQRVYFSAPGAERVDLLELSDGYRSFLALVIDLLRQTADVFGSVTNQIEGGPDGALTVAADGVVLIDEVDLHLHPTWQRELGPRLQEVFPRIQFIVSSHSPFIAQAATKDGLFVLQAAERGQPVAVRRPAPQVSGWTAEQILLSQLFGLTETRAPNIERLLQEHAMLRGRAKFGSLERGDKARIEELGTELAGLLASPGELRKDEVDAFVKLAADKVRSALRAEARTPSAQ